MEIFGWQAGLVVNLLIEVQIAALGARLTLQDISSLVATVAAVSAAIYAALAYHKPKEAKPVARGSRTTAAPSPPKRWPVLVLALAAWLAVGVDYVDRHFWATDPDAALPISSDNARLDIGKLDPILKRGSPNSWFLNIYIVNHGKSAAISMQHLGSIATSPGMLGSPDVDAMFAMLQAQLRAAPIIGNSEIEPGDDRAWFTVPPVLPGITFDDAGLQAVSDGKQLIYLFNVMRYRDNSLAPGKFIYTETCAYFAGPTLHNCEAGHNRSYIAR